MEFKRVGRIFNTRGLRGELKVKPTTDFLEERFKKGNVLFLDKDQALTIKRVNNYKNGNIIVVFEGLEDINLVEHFKGHDLYVEGDEEFLDEDEYYIDDLIGLKLYNQNNVYQGEIVEVMMTGANSVLRLDDNRLIPYVDKFIKEVDLVDGKIVMELIEGL